MVRHRLHYLVEKALVAIEQQALAERREAELVRILVRIEPRHHHLRSEVIADRRRVAVGVLTVGGVDAPLVFVEDHPVRLRRFTVVVVVVTLR